MTQQAKDAIAYDGADYSIGLCEGTGLFELPEMPGRVLSFSTACHRGFRVRYAVRYGRLRLAELVFFASDEWVRRLRAGERKVIVCGRVPRLLSDDQRASRACGDAIVEDADFPVAFSGAMLAVRDADPHDPLGRVWSWRHALEMRFAAGELVFVADRSEELDCCRCVHRVRQRTAAADRDRVGGSKAIPDLPESVRAERETCIRRRLRWPLGPQAMTMPPESRLSEAVPDRFAREVLSFKLRALLPDDDADAVLSQGTLGELIGRLLERWCDELR